MQDYNGSSCASWATAYMNVQNADGSFSDVDYDNTDQTNWVPTEHYMRMVYMSVAYVSPIISKTKSEHFQKRNVIFE